MLPSVTRAKTSEIAGWVSRKGRLKAPFCLYLREEHRILAFCGSRARRALARPLALRFDRGRSCDGVVNEGVSEGVRSRCAAARKEVEEGDVRGLLLRAQRPLRPAPRRALPDLPALSPRRAQAAGATASRVPPR